MSIINKLKRFELILTKVEQSKYPTFDEILKYLERYDRSVSHRTLQRDFDELNREFRIVLEYDKRYKGYSIERNTLIDGVIQFIKNMSLHASLLEFTRAADHSHKIILKEEYHLKGVEWIPSLLEAIRHHMEVKLAYHPFGVTASKAYTLRPYALKEFLGRWYVAGILPDRTGVFKFGVDRIVEVHHTHKKFKMDKNVNLSEYFSRMIGIIDDGGKCDTVILSFTEFQANYIRTLPLHWTQKELPGKDKKVQFEYFLLLNYELLQKIMSYGSEVRVIKPASLQRWHKEMLKQSLAGYK
jgi:predicted DNA-binding transcriptional regulator YafY